MSKIKATVKVNTSKIFKAEKFINNGDPLKDVLSDSEIEDAIVMLANLIREMKSLKDSK